MSGGSCDRCGDVSPGRLFVTVDGVVYCSACWRRAGRPFPRSIATVTELHEAEVVTRDRMLARGGAYRHLVRKGLT